MADPLNLLIASNQRIDLTKLGLFIKVQGVGVERASTGRLTIGILFAKLLPKKIGTLVARNFRDAMGDVVHHINTRNFLLLKEVDGLTLLLTKNSHQHISAVDLFFSRALDMKNGTL